jgi:hypothetical protein
MYDRYLDEVFDELAEEFDAGYDLLGEESDYAQPPNVFPVFLSGYRTVPGEEGRRPMFRRTQGRIGPRRRAINALFPPAQAAGRRGMQSRGIWVQGGLSDVRRYTQQLFPGQQLDISNPEAHSGGQSHVHVTLPGRGRSEHIFYGPPPRANQNFFD